jgi:Golgi phosphoprotein 3 (GPP34)
MAGPNALHLYEEVRLLSLRDREGTVANSYAGYAVAAAVLAEMLLEKRIATAGTSRKLVDLQKHAPSGDYLIDECQDMIRLHWRRADVIGNATKEVIDAMEMAVMVAAIMPALATSTS